MLKRCIIIPILTVTVFLFVLGTNASALTAAETDFSFNSPKGYTEFTNGGAQNHIKTVEALGYTVSSLNSYFEKESIIYFGLNNDNSKQIIAKCVKTDFSSELDDFSLLEEEKVLSVGETLTSGFEKNGYTVLSIGNTVYYSASSLQSDGNGQFLCIQYFTVKNGKLYTVSFYNNANPDDAGFVEETTEIMRSVNIKGKIKTADKSPGNIMTVILIWVLIIGAGAVVVISSYLFIRDVGKRAEEDETVTISRKKYGKK